MTGNSLLTRVLTEMSGLSLDRLEAYTRILLKFGANPNLEESGRDSTLVHAVRLQSHELVRALIEAGADVNHVGQMNLTALHIYFMPIHMKGLVTFLTQNFEFKNRQCCSTPEVVVLTSNDILGSDNGGKDHRT